MPNRTIRSGPYIPTVARSGDIGDNALWRKSNMITKGRNEGVQYEQCFAGAFDMSQNLSCVVLTGTLAMTANSTTITGSGTAFATELHIGQYILVPSVDASSRLLVVDSITSNTVFIAGKAPNASASGKTGYRMPIAFAVNDASGTLLRGNALKLDKGSYISVGDGVFRSNGAVLPGSSLTATRHPQLSLYDSTSNTYTNFPLGMDTSVAPTLASVAGGTKGMVAGKYSIRITPNRTQTNGYNNASLRADVDLAAGNQIAVTFPAMDVANGQNAWGVWGTLFSEALGADKNFLNGPWFFVQQVSVDPAGYTMNFEWLDAEIEENDPLTFDNDEPVDAEFVSLLNAVPVYLSCQGSGDPISGNPTSPGPVIVPAKFTNIEAAPLTLAFPTSPPETILGYVSAQGKVYLLTSNHLQIAQATPDSSVPILIRPFWKDGFKNPYQVQFVNGTLYGYPVSGPSRSVGDGDEIQGEKSWAAYVAEIIETWTPGQVMVAHDPGNNAICFFHAADSLNSSGFWTTRVLMYGLAQEQWIGDITLTSTAEDRIVSGVATVGDNLIILVGGQNAGSPRVKTCTWDKAAGESISWYQTPQLTDHGNEQRASVVKGFTVTGKLTNGIASIYTYAVSALIDTAAIDAGTGSTTGPISLGTTANVTRLPRVQVNCANASLSTIRVAGTFPGSGTPDRVDEIAYDFMPQGVRR